MEIEFPWAKLTFVNDDLHFGIGPRYESAITSRMKEWVREGDLCLDIGAHQGLYTTLLSKTVGDSGIVHAFEPHPVNFQTLTENLKKNDCKNVIAHNEALGNETGSTVMHEFGGMFSTPRAHLGKRRGPPGADLEVSIKRLDSYSFEKPVKFIKMDVEFWEIEVIKGGRNTIAKDRPVMMVETHGKRNEELVRNFFKDRSFDLEELDIRNPLNYHFLLKPRPVSAEQEPVISTVLLSFNRLSMLKRTVDSYLSTISVPYELVIVDNVSTDGSREYIQEICNGKPNHKAILLEKDEGGGEAINRGIEHARGKYIHVSENDIEYFPGWDREMIRKFEAFPELGQISPKSISPGAKQIPKRLTNGNDAILAVNWITSTCVFRREIWSWGARWQSIENKPGSKYRPPGDVKFSFTVGKLGYLVAWNDKNMVANMGFRFKEMIRNIDYYVENYRSKFDNGVELLRETLRKKGYELVEENGRYKAVLKDEAQKAR